MPLCTAPGCGISVPDGHKYCQYRTYPLEIAVWDISRWRMSKSSCQLNHCFWSFQAWYCLHQWIFLICIDDKNSEYQRWRSRLPLWRNAGFDAETSKRFSPSPTVFVYLLTYLGLDKSHESIEDLGWPLALYFWVWFWYMFHFVSGYSCYLAFACSVFLLAPLFTISFQVFCLKCSGIYKPLTNICVWSDIHL